MRSTRNVSRVLLVLLSCAIALGMQRYVGGPTIYAPERAERRAMVHEAILHNVRPEGLTWSESGGNGMTTRIGTVYAAEGVHRILRWSLEKSYFAIETGALVLVLVSLFIYLQRGATAQLALIGLLFVSAIQPLTYAFYFFHPWDRPSLVAWICVLWFLRENKPGWAAAILPIAVLIKWDIVVLPVLYFLAYARNGAVPRVLAITAGMGVVGVVTYLVVRGFLPIGTTTVLPGGTENIGEQLRMNVRDIVALWVFYPPMLGLALPIIAAAIGFRTGTRFERASFCFGLALLVPMFILTHFLEVRAEMPIVVLVLPLALRGVQLLLSDRSFDQGTLVTPSTA